MRKGLAAVTVVAGLAAAGPASAAETAPVVEDQYIVTFKPGTKNVADLARDVTDEHDGQLKKTFKHALKGFVAKVPDGELAALKADPDVQSVEPDRIVEAFDTQTGATWGLDRIDQRTLPLDGSYRDGNEGAGVHAYVLDTGIRLTHVEFAGRMGNGYDAVTAGGNASDCHGHGTHVAGTVGGATYGVADKVTLHPVRVLGCNGSGSTSGIVAGIDWVTANHVKPAVANMSLGGGVSPALDTAVANSISNGVTYAIAAGNSNLDACSFSPARTPAAITVGATTNTDARASFSNFGTCLDVFAPGAGITSAWRTSNTATNTISGTSMASPHAAGAAALFLAANRDASPAAVRDAIVGGATAGVVTDPGVGSNNILLHNGTVSAPSVTLYSDDFEDSGAWTPNAQGTDTATTGLWEHGDPEETNSSGPKQLGTTPSGLNDLMTGRLAGASAGDHDIDGGVTSITSPAIELTGTGTFALTLDSYLAHGSNSSSADFLRVRVLDGSTLTTVHNRNGAAIDVDGAWGTTTVSLQAFAGKTIQIVVEAADAATASLVEAGVDNVRVTRS